MILTKYYHIRFKLLFDSGVWLCRAQAVWHHLPKQTWAISDPEHSARVILVPLFSRFSPILRTFRPLLNQCSPIVRSFGSLDYSAALLSRKQGRVSFDNYLFWRYFLLPVHLSWRGVIDICNLDFRIKSLNFIDHWFPWNKCPCSPVPPNPWEVLIKII